MRALRSLLLLLTGLFAGVHSLLAATTIPFEFRNGLIWLKVAVGEQSRPLNFLLDSGAGASVLNLESARRLGIPLGAQRVVQGTGGCCTAYQVKGISASLAGITLSESMLAVNLNEVSKGCGRQIDGLVGIDFFRGHAIQIDFQAEKLRVLSPEEIPARGVECLPLRSRNGTVCTQVAMNGAAPQWFRVDTGCSTAIEWVVTENAARKFNRTTVGLNAAAATGIYADVQLGTNCIKSVKAGIHANPMFPGEAGLLGNGLLSRFLLTIDVAHGRCFLANR